MAESVERERERERVRIGSVGGRRDKLLIIITYRTL